MNYRMLLSSMAAIAGIALAIIGLSIEHRHQQEKVTATESPAAVVPQQPAISDKFIVAGGHCNIERIDGGLFTESVSHTRTLPIELSGWIVNPVTKSVPTDAEVRMQDDTSHQVWTVPLTTSISRPDVVANQGDEKAYLRSGFTVRINPARLTDGDYHILIQYQSGGKTHVCDNGRRLQITG